jgi:hypothetical protein
VEANAGDALLLLSRKNAKWRDRLRSYRVILDDDEVARIKRGQDLELPVSAGRHQILLEIDWCSSPTVEFDAQPGEVIRFVCEPAEADQARTAVMHALATYINLTRE